MQRNIIVLLYCCGYFTHSVISKHHGIYTQMSVLWRVQLCIQLQYFKFPNQGGKEIKPNHFRKLQSDWLKNPHIQQIDWSKVKVHQRWPSMKVLSDLHTERHCIGVKDMRLSLFHIDMLAPWVYVKVWKLSLSVETALWDSTMSCTGKYSRSINCCWFCSIIQVTSSKWVSELG